MPLLPEKYQKTLLLQHMLGIANCLAGGCSSIHIEHSPEPGEQFGPPGCKCRIGTGKQFNGWRSYIQHGHRIGETEMISGDDQGPLFRKVFFADHLQISEDAKGSCQGPFDQRSNPQSPGILNTRHKNELLRFNAFQPFCITPAAVQKKVFQENGSDNNDRRCAGPGRPQ